MGEFDIRYQEYVIKNNLQGKTEQEVLTHMEQSGWLTPEEAQTLRTSGAFSVRKTLTHTHTDEFQSTLNNKETQSQTVPKPIVLTEEQAQEQAIKSIAKDVIDARDILMRVDNGIITKGYDKLKTSSFNIKKAGKEDEYRKNIMNVNLVFGNHVSYLVSGYLYDKYMEMGDLSYSNVEENVALQAVGTTNMQLAKNNQLSKKEYYLQNKEHLKTMLVRRLYMKDLKSGDSFIDRNRGNMSQEEFGKFLENYINDMVDNIQELDSIKSMQSKLTTFSGEETEEFCQKLLENAKNQPQKVGEVTFKISQPAVPAEFNTTEPISFEEVFRYERGREFSKENIESFLNIEADFNYTIGAFNKHQVLKNAVDGYRKDYDKHYSSAGMASAEGVVIPLEPSPIAQAEKVTTIFEEYFANPINPNLAKEKLEEIISTNKLPIIVNSNENGELSLDLSALTSDNTKNRALNNILSLLMQEQNRQLEEIMGGNPDDTMFRYQQKYSLSRDSAYGSEYSNDLAKAMDNDNKTVIKRVTGNVSSAGMGMTVVGGVLCFTPLAPLGATLLTAGNATAITGMVSESALGYTEALTRNDISEEELIEITKTTLMNAGGFGVGMVAGKVGMKAFKDIIDEKLVATFNKEIANGNRAAALKAVFCDPNNLANFMQAAGAKVGTDFLISYAGDLAMMGVLGTQDDWQSLLKSNLIGIMVGMSSDIKDVSGVNGRFGSAKPKQETKPFGMMAMSSNVRPETTRVTLDDNVRPIDNTEPVRPEGKAEQIKPESSGETASSKSNEDGSNPLRPKKFETTDAYKLTEVVSESDLTRPGSDLLTTVEGKKVLTPEADEMVRNIAEQIHNLAIKEESGIVDIMIKMGLGTEETLRHRSKSVQSTYDKIKNALIDDEKCSLKDAVGTVFDGVGVRTVSTIDNFAKHPAVKKYLDAGDYKTAYQKAVELESNFVLESLMKYVDLCAEGKNEVTLTRISNYMGEDGIPYFTEKQLQHLKAYAQSKGVNIPIVERVMDYVEHAQAQTESSYRAKSTTKVRGSGYTALQMNFVTKDGFSYEWQYRGEKLNGFAEAEHIPYDLRTNKDIIGTHTELTRLYEPLKDLLTNKEKMSDTMYEEYNHYLTAYYEYLRLVELGFVDGSNPPMLPKGFDERLRAENLELIHEIADKIKENPEKEAKYLNEYESRLVRNTDENTTTTSYTEQANLRAQNRTINIDEAQTRLGANREGTDVESIARIIDACKNTEGGITDKLVTEAELLLYHGVSEQNIIRALNEVKAGTLESFAKKFIETKDANPTKSADEIFNNVIEKATLTPESIEANYPNRFSPRDKEMIMQLAQENQELVAKLLEYKNADGDYRLNYHRLPRVFEAIKSDSETGLKLLDLKNSKNEFLVDIQELLTVLKNEEATLEQCLRLAQAKNPDGRYYCENIGLKRMTDTDKCCDLDIKIKLYEMKNNDGKARFSNREVNNILYIIDDNPELSLKLLEMKNSDGTYRFDNVNKIENYMNRVQYYFKDKDLAFALLDMKNSNGEYRLSEEEFVKFTRQFENKDIDPILKDLFAEQNADGSFKYTYNDAIELYNAKQVSNESYQALRVQKDEVAQIANSLSDKYGKVLTLEERTAIAKLPPEQRANALELLEYRVEVDGKTYRRFSNEDALQLADCNIENVLRLANVRIEENGNFIFRTQDIKSLSRFENINDVIYLANLRRDFGDDKIQYYNTTDIELIMSKDILDNVRTLHDLNYINPDGNLVPRFTDLDLIRYLAEIDNVDNVMKIADLYWESDGEPRFNDLNSFKRLAQLDNLDDVLRVAKLKSHHSKYTEYRWGIGDCIAMAKKDYNNIVDILNIEVNGKKVFTMDDAKKFADYKASDINTLVQIKQEGADENYLDTQGILKILEARKESNSDMPIDFFAEQFEYYLNLKTKSGNRIFDGREGRMEEFDVINYMASLPEVSKEATSMRMLTQMVQDEVIDAHMLKYMPKEGKLNPLISQEIQTFFDAYLNNIPFKDVLVPDYSSLADASANTKTGDVFNVAGEDRIYIKNEDGTTTQLEMSKELYCYLFPPIERYTTTQNDIGNCWQINGFNSILRDPRERINVLKCFKEDGNDIVLKFPNGKLEEIRFVNGKFPEGSDRKYYSEGAYGINYLEYAQAKEMQKDAIDAVVNELNHQIAIANNDFDLQFYTQQLTVFTEFIERGGDKIFIDENGHLQKDKIDNPTFDLAITEFRDGGRSNEVWDLLGYEKSTCLAKSNSDDLLVMKLLLDSPELFDEHIIGWASAGYGMEASVLESKGIVSNHAYWLKQNLDDNGNVINYSVFNPWGILETTLTREEVLNYGKALYVAQRK